MRLRCVALFVALWTVLTAAADPPKLAVLIVVDQMRADYVDRFQGDWNGGLKRLVTKGAWFTEAAYPYLSTFTCSGHATIGTGAYPRTHGIFQNQWFDRDRKAIVTCTQDPSVKPVSYAKEVKGGESAAALVVPTFAEEMARQRGAHVASLSLKARSAIMLAGHRGDAVTWLSDSLDGWETSTAFSPAVVPAVSAFLAANRIESDYGKIWDRQMPASRYGNPDAGLGEAPPNGWNAVFPHVLKGKPGDSSPTDAYYAQWERSPFADAFLGRMAASLVESMQLGKHDTTDVLAISFSSPDLVGHVFGPRSQEIEDLYIHLDRTIGSLLDRLDALVGPDNYVVALSADHGVTEIPEQTRASGKSGGHIDSRGVFDAIERAAVRTAGPGPYLSRLSSNDVYFEPGMFEKLKKTPSGIEAVLRAATARPGVQRVFRGDELVSASRSSDSLTRAAALSFVKERSGDLVLAPSPGWLSSNAAGTTHGSANPDDRRVPIILFGNGIKPGKYPAAASPADIAPTLAALCGITLSRADGSILKAALN